MARPEPETCLTGGAGLSAPIFGFGGFGDLPARDAYLHEHVPNGWAAASFAMTGPGATAEAGHLPVRGDLAHINLAGRYFVPHYAVPMPHRVTTGGTVLRQAGHDNAEAVEALAAGTVFNVLDMSGGWAWGQVGEDGFVGYLPLAALVA
jgi:Bacterial dipeptidyl-peptidase Sh3 domain